MQINNPDLVIVRGINDTWFKENLSKMWIGFGGDPKGIPKEDAYFVGLYLQAPVSAIKYIGVVSEIDRYSRGADFYLKALIELPEPIQPGHAIRKQEYWNIKEFGLDENRIALLRQLVDF
ncbi:MAG: hypothetical protein ACTHMD_08505 [Flavisolibacter sp.]